MMNNNLGQFLPFILIFIAVLAGFLYFIFKIIFYFYFFVKIFKESRNQASIRLQQEPFTRQVYSRGQEYEEIVDGFPIRYKWEGYSDYQREHLLWKINDLNRI